MKRRLAWLLLPILILGLAWGWFARPIGLGQMFSGFSWEQIDSISGSYVQFGVSNGTAKTTSGLLEPIPLDGEAQALVEQFSSARFSRSLWGTVQDRLSSTYSPSQSDSGDSAMILSLSGGGSVLTLDLFGDRLIITYYPQGDMDLGAIRRVCSGKGQEALINGFLAYLKAYGTIQ